MKTEEVLRRAYVVRDLRELRDDLSTAKHGSPIYIYDLLDALTAEEWKLLGDPDTFYAIFHEPAKATDIRAAALDVYESDLEMIRKRKQ